MYWKKPEKEIFDGFKKMMEEMNKSIEHLISSSGSEPFVYGFGIQLGPDGIPHIEHFGNTRTSAREPFTSSMVKDNELGITAEMPGVQKEDIKINATESEVTIRTEGDRKYYKCITTPSPVDPDSAKAKYNNGILELTLRLREPIKQGKNVKIE